MQIPPNLTGKVCEAFLMQEYWYESAKECDVNLLYLKVQGEKWHRFFFDCGPLFWREVDAPDVWNTTPADAHHYPQIDIGTPLGVVGQTIDSVELVGEDMGNEVHLRFANGTLIVLRDNCPQEDSMSLLVFQSVDQKTV